MRRASGEAGYVLMDLMVGFGLLGFVLLATSYLFGSTFLLSRDLNTRLGRQQDVRLALDRVARALRETTDGFGRLRVYPPAAGCTGAYEGCLGFVTAREACTGPFQLIEGAPDWQATFYLWRDTRSNELRLKCDPGTTFPVVRWPQAVKGPRSPVIDPGLAPRGQTPQHPPGGAGKVPNFGPLR